MTCINIVDSLRRRPGGRSARVRSVVFAATLDLLAERGWTSVSMGAIATRAGVHETSLYRRWKSREALVVAALLDSIADAIPIPDSGSLRGDLIAAARSALAYFRSPLGGAVVRMTVAMPPGEDATALRRAFWAVRFPAVQIIFSRAVERGEIGSDADAQLMLQMLFGLVHLRVFVLDERNDDKLAEHAVDLLLAGVLGAGR